MSAIDWSSPTWGRPETCVHGDEHAPLFVSPYARLVGDPRVTYDDRGSWLTESTRDEE